MSKPKSALDSLIDNIAKQGVDVSRLSDDSSPCVVSGFMSTGTYVLDAIMGGGLPLGRVVEMYGDTSTGKSLIAAQACACAQDEGCLALYIDTETAVSLPIMEAVGVDIDNLAYTAPDTVEDVFKVMESAIDAKADSQLLIIWDSIAATSAVAEMDKKTGDVGYLTHARVISQGLRRLVRIISKERVACLFLNQAKQKMGVLYGDKVATFGGKAIGFHSSIRVQLRVGKKIKSGKKRIVGINVVAKVTKNKIAPPFREATLPIYFGYGVDDAEAALLYLKAAGLIKYVNGYYVWDDRPKFRKVGWQGLYDSDYDNICDLIDHAVRDEDLI